MRKKCIYYVYPIFKHWRLSPLSQKSFLTWAHHLFLTEPNTISHCKFWFDHLFFFPPFIFISWRLITLQYCSGFCHTLIWISHGFTCAPHPDPPSHLPLHPIPLGLPSAPALSTCLVHPTWAIWSERIALKHINYQAWNRSTILLMILSALSS